MDYIVLDLEWNQASDSNDSRSRMLTFEIIEIGAVKLNRCMEIVDTFHELIRPQVYEEMHKITEKLIQIHMDELTQCRLFEEVMRDFLSWCGEDYMFGTWGPLDLTELQRNMTFFGMEPLAGGPFKFYDIQKMFSIAFEDGRSRRSLEYGVDFLNITKDIPFHRALSDAWYTARVLQMIKDPMVLQRISFDTYSLPKDRRSEIHVVFDNYAKYISRAFADKEALMTDREVISTRCYLCHRNLRRKIRWFSPNGKHYYSISWCDKHGYMKGKIRVKKADNDMVYAVKTTKFISEKEMAQIQMKKEHTKQLRKEHQRRRS
ncbi:MAG: exonuclease domain-containing protein [Lachnospiraceae bacterium]|nr:exonuclease domain-containing protein [Lachnospiraceae bacterium]